jgi:hypothetical protein
MTDKGISVSATEYQALLELALSAIAMVRDGVVHGSDLTFVTDQAQIWTDARAARGRNDIRGDA